MLPVSHACTARPVRFLRTHRVVSLYESAPLGPLGETASYASLAPARNTLDLPRRKGQRVLFYVCFADVQEKNSRISTKIDQVGTKFTTFSTVACLQTTSQ